MPQAESSLQQNIILANTVIYPTLFDLMGLRWAPAVADLDASKLMEEEFVFRKRMELLKNGVYDYSSHQVDEFLRIPEGERRPDLYRPQHGIPTVHPNGYNGSGFNRIEAPLRESFDGMIQPPPQGTYELRSNERAPVTPVVPDATHSGKSETSSMSVHESFGGSAQFRSPVPGVERSRPISTLPVLPLSEIPEPSPSISPVPPAEVAPSIQQRAPVLFSEPSIPLPALRRAQDENHPDRRSSSTMSNSTRFVNDTSGRAHLIRTVPHQPDREVRISLPSWIKRSDGDPSERGATVRLLPNTP